MIFRCPVDDTIMVRQRGKRKMVVDITSIAKQGNLYGQHNYYRYTFCTKCYGIDTKKHNTCTY